MFTKPTHPRIVAWRISNQRWSKFHILDDNPLWTRCSVEVPQGAFVADNERAKTIKLGDVCVVCLNLNVGGNRVEGSLEGSGQGAGKAAGPAKSGAGEAGGSAPR